MNQRALIISVIVFIAIIGAMFGYAHMKQTELTRPDIVVPNIPTTVDTGEVRVNAVHFFRDNTHTVIGDVLVPTPCDLLTSDASVAESMPEQVTITLRTVNNDNTCAEVHTLQRFRVDFTASRDAVIRATLNGTEVILNLRDAEPGTEPEKLEDLYFKG